MLRVFLFAACCAVTARAVAVPPYEPLPEKKTGFSYTPAVQSSPSQPAGAAAIANPSWEMMSQMQQMQEEIQTLRGMVEELKHQVDVMQQQERQRYLDLDMRINQAQGTSSSPGEVKRQTVEQVADDKALYQQASDHRKKHQYKQAIAVLEQLQKQSPDGLYAPYSDYWLGELYMAVKPADLIQAKKHFINLLANHSDHVKVPDAMYKLGKLYAQQGKTENAKSTLNELIKKFPDKSAANLAKDLLKTL